MCVVLGTGYGTWKHALRVVSYPCPAQNGYEGYMGFWLYCEELIGPWRCYVEWEGTCVKGIHCPEEDPYLIKRYLSSEHAMRKILRVYTMLCSLSSLSPLSLSFFFLKENSVCFSCLVGICLPCMVSGIEHISVLVLWRWSFFKWQV